MPEIAAMGALERLDMMLNDAIYGILFRDINMQRTLVDQYFSRVIIGYCGIIFNSGEDNYLTTDDAYEAAHTVTASQFINEQFAVLAAVEDLDLAVTVHLRGEEDLQKRATADVADGALETPAGVDLAVGQKAQVPQAAVASLEDDSFLRPGLKQAFLE